MEKLLDYDMYRNDVYISSLHISHFLKKKHSDVLRKIREVDNKLYYYKEFNDFKLFKGSYNDKQGKSRPLYLFNRLFMLHLLFEYENKNNYKEIYTIMLDVSEFEISCHKDGFLYSDNKEYEEFEDCNAHVIKLKYGVDVSF